MLGVTERIEAFEKYRHALGNDIPVSAFGNPGDMDHIHEWEVAPGNLGLLGVRLDVAVNVRAETSVTDLFASRIRSL